MPKPAIVIGLIVGAVVIAGGATLAAVLSNNSSNNQSNQSSTTQSDKTTKIDDPEGVYDFFSDPSVTSYPEKGVKFGNGQTLSFEYDGSKTMNDEYATLSYQLYYIQDNGKVIPMGGGNLEGRGSGTFTVSDSVFNSSAKNRDGFLELQGTYTEGTSGTNVTLGMYPIAFDIAD